MRHSLTARVANLSDDVRMLRITVNALALCLLDDDHGISQPALDHLQLLLRIVGGVAIGQVDATDGRFYLSREEV